MKFVSVEQLRTEACRALWQWYLSHQGGGNDGRSWPPRDAFRPEGLPPRVLPHLGVVDVELDPFRVYYRIIGSAIADSLGRTNIQGYLDSLGLDQEAELIALYQYAVKVDRPLFLSGQQVIDGQDFTYEGGALPLGAPADPVRRFIIFEDYLHTDAWRSAIRRRSYRPDFD